MSSLLAATVAATEQSTGETLVFWACAIVAVCGALGMLFSKRAVHSALFIASTMMSLAVLYVSQQAPFLGMVQVVVYTGAVMMLFLFVLMIVGVDSSDSLVETIKGQRLAAIVLGLALGKDVTAVFPTGAPRPGPSSGSTRPTPSTAATCRASPT